MGAVPGLSLVTEEKKRAEGAVGAPRLTGCRAAGSASAWELLIHSAAVIVTAEVERGQRWEHVSRPAWSDLSGREGVSVLVAWYYRPGWEESQGGQDSGRCPGVKAWCLAVIIGVSSRCEAEGQGGSWGPGTPRRHRMHPGVSQGRWGPQTTAPGVRVGL